MRRLLPLLTLPVLLPAFFHALPAHADEGAGGKVNEESERYEGCLTAAIAEPLPAMEAARKWLEAGGGAPAKHCMAMATLAKGDPAGAAILFERLADEVMRGIGLSQSMGDSAGSRADLAAELFAEAGNARLLAHDPAAALPLLDKALAASSAHPSRATWLSDRGRASLLLKDYVTALKDLEAAAALDPQSAELSLYRAEAQKGLKQYDAALALASTAVGLDPSNPLGYLTRAEIETLKGSRAAAEADWALVVKRFPGTEAARTAERNLAATPTPPHP